MENSSAQNSDGKTKRRPRVGVVGSGFAGFTCMRELEKWVAPEDAELAPVSASDYMPYSPLLPEVAAGAMGARHVVVPMYGALKRARLVLGYATGVDSDARTCTDLRGGRRRGPQRRPRGGHHLGFRLARKSNGAVRRGDHRCPVRLGTGVAERGGAFLMANTRVAGSWAGGETGPASGHLPAGEMCPVVATFERKGPSPWRSPKGRRSDGA
jgi:hypothetical protein